jgi:murein hydrolase activator
MGPGALRVCALVVLAASALATISSASPADAQTTRSLAQVERDRRAEAARVERLRAEAAAARRDAAALNARLSASAQRQAEAEAAAAQAAARLAAAENAISAESARIVAARKAVQNALIAAALAQRRIDIGATRRAVFVRAAAPALMAQMREARRGLAENTAVARAAVQERRTLAESGAAIATERTQLAEAVAARRAEQTRLARTADAAERRMRTLAAQARTLRELAQRVQRASAVGRPRAPTNSAIPTHWLAPVAGSIARSFGAREAGAPAAQGAALRTQAGAPVIAPAAGRVSYAGLFRSYGQVLILELDGGYVLVLTGLGSITARVGETVMGGQPVGQMSASDTPAPELYVEVRRDGHPLDPGQWLGARGLSAEGRGQTGGG